MSDLVLVVGRELAITEFLATVLQRGGIDARAIPSDDAATSVNELEPALVLVDTFLAPVRSIRALADAKKASVPIVVLGAENPSPTATADATEAGATHYVLRPINDTVLVNGMRSILASG